MPKSPYLFIAATRCDYFIPSAASNVASSQAPNSIPNCVL